MATSGTIMNLPRWGEVCCFVLITLFFLISVGFYEEGLFPQECENILMQLLVVLTMVVRLWGFNWQPEFSYGNLGNWNTTNEARGACFMALTRQFVIVPWIAIGSVQTWVLFNGPHGQYYAVLNHCTGDIFHLALLWWYTDKREGVSEKPNRDYKLIPVKITVGLAAVSYTTLALWVIYHHWAIRGFILVVQFSIEVWYNTNSDLYRLPHFRGKRFSWALLGNHFCMGLCMGPMHFFFLPELMKMQFQSTLVSYGCMALKGILIPIFAAVFIFLDKERRTTPVEIPTWSKIIRFFFVGLSIAALVELSTELGQGLSIFGILLVLVDTSRRLLLDNLSNVSFRMGKALEVEDKFVLDYLLKWGVLNMDLCSAVLEPLKLSLEMKNRWLAPVFMLFEEVIYSFMVIKHTIWRLYPRTSSNSCSICKEV